MDGADQLGRLPPIRKTQVYSFSAEGPLPCILIIIHNLDNQMIRLEFQDMKVRIGNIGGFGYGSFPVGNVVFGDFPEAPGPGEPGFQVLRAARQERRTNQKVQDSNGKYLFHSIVLKYRLKKLVS